MATPHVAGMVALLYKPPHEEVRSVTKTSDSEGRNMWTPETLILAGYLLIVGGYVIKMLH
jgi:hypothetical protein